MLRLSIALLLTILGGATALATTPAPTAAVWLEDLESARAVAREQEKLVFVDLFAEWCHWCHILESSVLAQPEFLAYAADHLVLTRIDADGELGGEIQRRYQVSGLPTTLVVDPELTLAARIEGYLGLDAFIASVRAQSEGFEAILERYREAEGADPATLEALADELFARTDGDRASTLYRRLLDGADPTIEPRLRWSYRLVESLRLAGQLDDATESLAQALAAVRGEFPTGSELEERLGLLAYQIAHDRGDCAAAIESLQAFVTRHPGSQLATPARRTLMRLQAEAPACT